MAAVSCGLSDGAAVLDLDYAEDSAADADANFVLTGAGGIVEIQGTAEKTPFTEAQFLELLALAQAGTGALFAAQLRAVEGRLMARRLEHGQAVGARLVLASHNPGKLVEITELVHAPLGLAVVSAGDLGLPEPVEDAPDFVGNARIKALAAARAEAGCRLG